MKGRKGSFVLWLAVGLLVLGVAAAWVARTAAAGYLRPIVEARLGQALAATVTVGSLEVQWMPPAIELEDITILAAGAEQPVVHVDRAVVGARWRELVGQPRRLRSVEIEGAQVDLRVAEDGATNLPRPQFEGGGAGVVIDSLELIAGEALLADGRVPLDLSMQRLTVRASGAGAGTYAGALQAADVVVGLPTGATYAGAASLRATWADGVLRTFGGRLQGPDLSVRLGHGELTPADGSWRFDLAAAGTAQLISRLGADPGPLETDWAFDGEISSTDGWQLEGELSSPRVAWGDLAIRDFRSPIVVNRERVRLPGYRGRLAVGALSGSAEVDLAEDERPGQVEYRIEGGQIPPLLRQLGIDFPSLRGTWSLAGNYEFESEDPKAGGGRAQLELAISHATRSLAWSRRLPVEIRGGGLDFTTSAAGARGESLTVTGGYSLESGRGDIRYRLVTQQVENWIDLFLEPSDDLVQWLPSGGQSTVTGRFHIATGSWNSRLELRQLDGSLGSLTVPRARAVLTLSAAGVRDLDLQLSRPRGAISVRGGVRLVDGSLSPKLDLSTQVAGWPAEELLRQLGLELPLTGDVNGSVDLSGAADAPIGDMRWQVAPLKVDQLTLDTVEADMRLEGGLLLVDRATVDVAGGSLSIAGSATLASGEVELTLESTPFDLAAESWAPWLPAETSGTIVGRGVVRGVVEDPHLEVELETSDLSWGGNPLGTAGAADLDVSLVDRELQIAGRLGELLTLDGGGECGWEACDLAIDVVSGQLGALTRLLVPLETGEFDGNFAGRLGLRAEPRAGTYEPTLVLDSLALSYAGQRLKALEPVELALLGDELEVRSFFLGDETGGSEIFVSGLMALSEGQALSLRTQASIDTRWLELALPGWQFEDGRVDVLATVAGTLGEPLLNGQGQWTQHRIRLPSVPQSAQEVSAVFLLYPGQVVVDEAQSRFAGGTVRLAGSVDLYEQEGLRYRFQVAAQGIELRYPEGWRVVGGGEFVVSSEIGGRQIRGQVELGRALFSNDVRVGLTQLLRGALARQPELVEETDELLATTLLNVAVTGPRALRVRNNVGDLRGTIDLVVRGNLARPVVFGEVGIEPGGTLLYSGNEYTVRRAELSFTNPFILEPVIDLEASTRLREYDITLNLAGTLERLEVDFASNPPLADLDVLTLLAGGESPTDGVSSDESAGSIAESFLYGQAASAVATRVNRLFGLDKFRIDPLTGESGSLSSARVTVGKRLSRDLFATYSYDPSQSEQQILQLEWQVSRLLTLVATQNGDSTYALDARWEKTF